MSVHCVRKLLSLSLIWEFCPIPIDFTRTFIYSCSMLKKSYLFIQPNLEKLANIRIPYLHCLKNNLNIRLRACHALEQIQRHMSGFCTKNGHLLCISFSHDMRRFKMFGVCLLKNYFKIIQFDPRKNPFNSSFLKLLTVSKKLWTFCLLNTWTQNNY